MTGKLLGSLTLVLAVALLTQHQVIIDFLFPSRQTPGFRTESVATVTAAEGAAVYLPAGGDHQPLAVGQNLFHHDQVETGSDSTVVIRFPQGEVIELEKRSRLLLESPSGQFPLLTLLTGRLRIQQVEPTTQIKIHRHSEIVPLHQFSSPRFVMNTGRRKAPKRDLPPNPAAATPAPANSAVSPAEQVQAVMANQKFWLDKCYATYLKDNPQGAGEIKVFFALEQNGMVKEAKVHSSTINDETMEKCVLQIVERARFQKVDSEDNQFIFPFQFSSQ